jgi:deazaflavin-dependent oxidoreductase (nitroreductase family)
MIDKFYSIRIFSKIHSAIYNISKGRVWGKFGKLEFVLLTTTGRKSGKKRSVPLLLIRASTSQGEKYLLVASYGGNSVHPAWLLNIRNDPSVHIRVGSGVNKATASIIEPTDASYEEMWNKAVNTYAAYDNYRNATTRRIPIVSMSFL